ncbi:MAG: hypothetical protein NUW23_02760 [Firmicutes bacterium]|nr:hypothetical protein [Bacillota bacterium]
MKSPVVAIAVLSALLMSACGVTQAEERSDFARPQWIQASYVIAQTVSFGVGLTISDRFALAFNIDNPTEGADASASLLYVLPGDFFILSRAYAGAGGTYVFKDERVYPHLMAGGEFRWLFAEFQWVMAPDTFGHARSRVRWRF